MATAKQYNVKAAKGDSIFRAYRDGDRASCTITFAQADLKDAKWLFASLKKDVRDVWIDFDDSPPVSTAVITIC